MTAPDLLAALTPVVEALEALGIPYHVGGSVASSVLGTARATLDVDVVARLEDVDVAPFVYQMDPEYYVDEAMIRDAIARRSSFNLIHQATAIKIDVFVLKSRLYDQSVAFSGVHHHLGQWPPLVRNGSTKGS